MVAAGRRLVAAAAEQGDYAGATGDNGGAIDVDADEAAGRWSPLLIPFEQNRPVHCFDRRSTRQTDVFAGFDRCGAGPRENEIRIRSNGDHIGSRCAAVVLEVDVEA